MPPQPSLRHGIILDRTSCVGKPAAEGRGRFAVVRVACNTIGKLRLGRQHRFLRKSQPPGIRIDGYMPTIDLTSDQVIELMQQMPVQERQKALAVLVQGLVSGEKERNESLAHGIREACEARGVQWDTMTDNGRETFIDDLLHEDRSCGS